MSEELKTIELTPEAYNVMKEDAIHSFPDECCGFFYGKIGTTRLVQVAVPVINSKDGDKRRRFFIDPLDYMKAERYALENDLTLLGVYHSHPLHPAIASEHDREVAMPWFSYVILSTFENSIADVKSWQLDEARNFKEENVLIFEPTQTKH